MSLLMDALKQAEHAKRDKRAETAPPPEPQAASVPTDEPRTAPAALSLAPAETPLQLQIEPGQSPHQNAHPIPDLSPETTTPTRAPEIADREPARSATPAAAPAPESTPEPASATPKRTTTQDAQTATRIFAAGQSRSAAQRRRNLLGIGGLGAVIALALGAYYYYAALAQTQPYLAMPQTGAAQLPAGGVAAAAITELAAEPIAESVTDPVAAPAAEESSPAPTLDAAATPPTQTPWIEGPPPAPLETQPWEPAPVDPRALRGELPPVAADDSEQPAAAPAPSITITRGSRANQANAALLDAYADYRAGRWVQAELTYRDVLAREPDNRDARLGLAALAVRAGQLDAARQHYRELLRRDPKDSVALAALTDLSQSAAVNSESALKLRLAEQPQSAQLQFALANLYAAQQRWPLAQQAYFEAQRLAPDNPDYAFNLAVSLEHIGQAKLALDYYRRAVQLAGAADQAARFDAGVAQQRIAALAVQQTP